MKLVISEHGNIRIRFLYQFKKRVRKSVFTFWTQDLCCVYWGSGSPFKKPRVPHRARDHLLSVSMEQSNTLCHCVSRFYVTLWVLCASFFLTQQFLKESSKYIFSVLCVCVFVYNMRGALDSCTPQLYWTQILRSIELRVKFEKMERPVQVPTLCDGVIKAFFFHTV